MVLLRIIGFVSTVFGANVPILLSVQYIAVAGTIIVGMFVIVRGVVIEPPAFVVEAFAKLVDRLSRRYATP
jgi:lipopolysaccharide export system permease protein